MIKNKDSLKAKASNLAKQTNIPNKYIIQNFMFEALLKKISNSNYKDKFIIKGGLLLSSIFGVNLRSTMDLDTTIKGLPLNKSTITKVITDSGAAIIVADRGGGSLANSVLRRNFPNKKVYDLLWYSENL